VTPDVKEAMTATQSKSSAARACWNCGAASAGAHFCPACERIQPLPRGAGYFEFFGLPEKLRLDAADLEQRFHQLSWKLHPDNFVRASDYERELSLERSAELNDAFRTLRDPIRRVEYLLRRAGLRKDGQSKQQAPPELLEEVFELNESLDELRAVRAASAGHGEHLAALRRQLESAEANFEKKLAEVDAELETVFAKWDAAVDAAASGDERNTLMARMNEILNRRAYIRNLVESVRKELSEAS
jgi:molecular chaperone HscB